MIEHVPGRAADEGARCPSLPAAWTGRHTFVDGDLERIEHRATDPLDALVLVTLRRPRPEQREVALVGAEHVIDDLVEVAAATTRALRELLAFGGIDGAVERSPARSKQRRQAREVLVADRLCVGGRRGVGRAEVGRGVARQALDDRENGWIHGRLEAEASATQDARVAGRV